jgi:hypothetical protein
MLSVTWRLSGRSSTNTTGGGNVSATAQLARPRASQLDDTHDRRVLFAEHGHRSHGFGKPGYLRFDFSATKGLSDSLKDEIEERCNVAIHDDFEGPASSTTRTIGGYFSPNMAIAPMALASSSGIWVSVTSTGRIGMLSLLGEQSVGSGTRRVEALVSTDAFRHTGQPARRHARSAGTFRRTWPSLPWLWRPPAASGSYNKPGYLRFDFSATKGLSDSLKDEIEERCNVAIHDRRVLFAEHGHRSHGFGVLQRHLGISNLEVVMNGNVATRGRASCAVALTLPPPVVLAC